MQALWEQENQSGIDTSGSSSSLQIEGDLIDQLRSIITGTVVSQVINIPANRVDGHLIWQTNSLDSEFCNRNKWLDSIRILLTIPFQRHIFKIERLVVQIRRNPPVIDQCKVPVCRPLSGKQLNIGATCPLSIRDIAGPGTQVFVRSFSRGRIGIVRLNPGDRTEDRFLFFRNSIAHLVRRRQLDKILLRFRWQQTGRSCSLDEWGELRCCVQKIGQCNQRSRRGLSDGLKIQVTGREFHRRSPVLNPRGRSGIATSGEIGKRHLEWLQSGWQGSQWRQRRRLSCRECCILSGKWGGCLNVRGAFRLMLQRRWCSIRGERNL